MAGTLLATQVLPETAPPLQAPLGLALPSSGTAPAGTSQEESTVQASTENHPDTSSTSKNSVYLSADVQSKQEASPVTRQMEATTRKSQWQAAPLTDSQVNESRSIAIPSALPAWLPDSTVFLHGSRPQDHVTSRQVGAPMQTRDRELSSPGVPSKQSTALPQVSSRTSSTPAADLPVAHAEVLDIPLSAAKNMPSAPVSLSLSQNAQQPGLATSRAAAVRVSDTQPFLPTRRAGASNAKAERDSAARSALAAPRQVQTPQNEQSNNAETLVAVPPSIGASAPVEASTEATAAEPGKHSEPSAGRSPGADIGNALLAQTLSKVPFAARSENLAFALHLQESKSNTARPPTAPQARPVRDQTVSNVRTEARLAPLAHPATLVKQMTGADVSRGLASLEIQPVWSEAPAIAHSVWGPIASAPAPAESHIQSAAALQDLPPVPPETPKPAVSGEIQLHLTANDQSSASIRVTDRAGAVNISVHASDPQVRNSLHSNLSELSSQLNIQGWKTEVVKTASVVTRTDSGRDTQPDGRHSSSQQQHSANAERQTQRDRRPSGGRWRDEIEEQITGNDASRGGKN